MVPLKGTSHNSLKRARDERGVVFYIKLPILSAYTQYDKKGGGTMYITLSDLIDILSLLCTVVGTSVLVLTLLLKLFNKKK